MTKFRWEQQLSKYLSELPKGERAKVLEYYDELFCDKFESGESEERIVESFGDASRTALEILRSYDSGMLFCEREERINIPTLQESQPRPQPLPPQGAQPTQPVQSIVQPVQPVQPIVKPSQPVQPIVQPIQSAQAVQPNGVYQNSQSAGQNTSKKVWKHPLMFILYAFLFVAIGIPIISAVFSIIVAVFAIIFSLCVCAGAGLIGAVITLFMGLPLAQTLAQIGMCLVVSGIGFLFIPPSVKLVKAMGKGFSKIISWIRGKHSNSESNTQKGN